MEGSVPCQPISFHCSDTSPGSVRSGNAACQRALRASCNAYKLLSFHTKANCTWHYLKLSMTFKWQHTWCSARDPSNGTLKRCCRYSSLSSCKKTFILSDLQDDAQITGNKTIDIGWWKIILLPQIKNAENGTRKREEMTFFQCLNWSLSPSVLWS